MPSDERDRQFERALERQLAGDGKARDAACPDAETLAAYHERTLGREELGQWKEHIVACTRCQEVLALLEATNSVPLYEWEEQQAAVQREGNSEGRQRSAARSSATESGAGRPVLAMAAAPQGTPVGGRKVEISSRWKWIVPMGALAAGLLVFVAVKENRTLPGSAPFEVAENRTPAAAPPPADTANQLRQSKSKSNAPVEQKQNHSSSQPPSAQPEQDRIANAGKEEVFGELAKKLNQVLPAQPAVIPPRSPEAAPPSPGASAGAASAYAGRAGTRPPAFAGALAAKTAPGGRNATSSAAPEAKAVLDSGEPGDDLPIRERARMDRSYIMAPGGKLFWRVGGGGRIEISRNRGESWVTQNSGVNSDLTSGSAASESICWIVGKAGTVLATSDGGLHWALVRLPTAEDLGEVQALDALHVTLWTASRQNAFQTADGGLTWLAVNP